MKTSLAAGMAASILVVAGVGAQQPTVAQLDSFTSADWLGLLPEGEVKRRFILDCTGCHQFDARIALTEGRPRTAGEWETAIDRMLGYAGATTGFPVISGDRDAKVTAQWLAQNVTRVPARRTPAARGQAAPPGTVTEFPLPRGQDLPHDVVVDGDGKVIITGMMTHEMHVLDPATRQVNTVAIPVQQANPRALDLDSAGNWWVVLGGPQMIARYAPGSGDWKTFPVGMYPHSLAMGTEGSVWFNGHFTRKPELIGRVTRAGSVETMEVPSHPTLADLPGGPIPYEIRVGRNGIVWGSELLGNRILSFDPASRRFHTYDLPTPHAGPRRLDVDADGIVWVPAYATNELLRFDPRSEKFTTYRLPIPDAVPYVVRVDTATNDVWIGTSAADAVLRFQRDTERFTLYELPSRGALVRHLTIDPRTHDLWAAYGAWPPHVPATVARIRGG